MVFANKQDLPGGEWDLFGVLKPCAVPVRQKERPGGVMSAFHRIGVAQVTRLRWEDVA